MYFGVGRVPFAKHSGNNIAHTAFALAALALDKEHYAPSVGRNKQIPHKLLQSGDIFGIKQVVKECKPFFGLGSIGVIPSGNAVKGKLLVLCKSPLVKAVSAV